MRHSLGSVTALAFAILAQSGAVRAEPWAINQFDVVNFELLTSELLFQNLTFDGAPELRWSSYTDIGVLEFADLLPVDAERLLGEVVAPSYDKEAMDEHLRFSADLFASWDLPEPKLDRIVEKSDGSQAYRLYLVQNLAVDKDNVSGLYNPGQCSDNRLARDARTRVVLLDSTDIFMNGRFTRYGQVVLSHELFHAVEFSTPVYGSMCSRSPGKWITEGLADAVGFDIALSRGVAAAPGSVSLDKAAGVRSYAVPLHKPADLQSEYGTSSFWRFLAEYHAHRVAGAPQPGPAAGPVHYGYLAPLLGHPPSVLGDSDAQQPQNEIGWLDRELKRAYRGKGLRDLYTLFVAGLPYYPYYRANRWVDTGEASDPDAWVRAMFGKCPDVVLTPSDPVSQTFIIKLEDIASACWRINVASFPENDETSSALYRGVLDDVIPVVVDVEGKKSDLEQLAAGKAQQTDTTGLALIARGEAPGPPPPVEVSTKVRVSPILDGGDTFQTEWAFPYGQAGGSFVLANVAKNAADTNPTGDMNVTFTALKEYASLGGDYDAGSLADAIDTPLELEFERYSAHVQQGQLTPHTDVGTVFSDGIVQPCVLNIFAGNKRPPGKFFPQELRLSLQLEGPIRPGTYPIAPRREWDGNYAHMMPEGEAQAGAMLYDLPDGHWDLQWDQGRLTIKSINRHLVRGYVEGVAHHWEAPDGSSVKVITDTRTLAAKFSIRVKGVLGRYRDFNYACIDPKPATGKKKK